MNPKTASMSVPRALHCYPSGDQLKMDYINSLPQPFIARMIGGGDWPVHDIEVQTALVRCDIVGKLQVFSISDVSAFVDADGNEHDPDTFWVDG